MTTGKYNDTQFIKLVQFSSVLQNDVNYSGLKRQVNNTQLQTTELSKRLESLSAWSGTVDDAQADLKRRLNALSASTSDIENTFDKKLSRTTELLDAKINALTKEGDTDITKLLNHPTIQGFKTQIGELHRTINTVTGGADPSAIIVPAFPSHEVEDRYPAVVVKREVYEGVPTYFEEIDSQRIYHKDTTGTVKENLIVDELHSVNNDHDRELNYIIPRFAPFFVKGLQISRVDEESGEDIPLELDVDYYLGGWFPEADEATHFNHVYGLILFDDEITNGQFKVTYQTLGGQFTLDERGYAQAIANYLENPLIVRWDEIVGRKLEFPPMKHEHDVNDLVGFEDLTYALYNLTGTVKSLIQRDASSDKAFSDFYELVKALRKKGLGDDETTGLKESIDSLVKKVKQLEQTATAQRLKDEGHDDELAKLKSNLTTNIDDLNERLLRNVSALDTDIRNTKANLVNNYTSLDLHRTENDAVNARIDDLATAQTQESAAVREFVKENVSEVRDKQTELNEGLATLQADVATHKEAIDDKVDQAETRLNQEDRALGQRIDGLAERLSSSDLKHTALADDHEQTKRKLDEVDKRQTAKVDALTKAVDALSANPEGASLTMVTAIDTRVQALETKDITTDAKLSELSAEDVRLSGKVDGLTTKQQELEERVAANQKKADDNAKKITAEATRLGQVITTNHNTLTTELGKLKSTTAGFASKEALAKTTQLANELKTKSAEQAKLISSASQAATSALTQVNALNGKFSQYVPLSRLQTTETTTTTNLIPVYQSSGMLTMRKIGLLDSGKGTGYASFTFSSGNNIVTLDKMFKASDISLLSDRRLKTNLTTLSDDLDNLQHITGYRYTRTDTGNTSIGVIAQEVETHFPELVQQGEDGHLSVNYNGLIALLLEKVKQQDKRIEQLEQQLNHGHKPL